MVSWSSLNIVHLKAFLFVEGIVCYNIHQRGFLTMTDNEAILSSLSYCWEETPWAKQLL